MNTRPGDQTVRDTEAGNSSDDEEEKRRRRRRRRRTISTPTGNNCIRGRRGEDSGETETVGARQATRGEPEWKRAAVDKAIRVLAAQERRNGKVGGGARSVSLPSSWGRGRRGEDEDESRTNSFLDFIFVFFFQRRRCFWRGLDRLLVGRLSCMRRWRPMWPNMRTNLLELGREKGIYGRKS
jgi:hypothetical protein